MGSSNISRPALGDGVEWNLRVDRHRDQEAFDRVRFEFEDLWTRARPLDPAWVAAYVERARLAPAPLPPGEEHAEPVERAPDPHRVQLEALAALADTRRDGSRRALVVLATGLGKTLLAVLDAEQVRREGGGTPIRVLFLAHREELLSQAADTLRKVLRVENPAVRIGWFAGGRDEIEADAVVASVAKLSRKEHLPRLATSRFDYVIVDEVHHADAESYRRILAALEALPPRFILGLTATPDRADQGDVLGLFDDNLPFRAGLDVGIEVGRLVPFRYLGLKDVIDYANIPWRNRRFDEAALARAAQTEARMEALWRAWQANPGTRSLVFCCSIAHAVYTRDWLRGRGLRVAAVFSAEGSDDRGDSLRMLDAGEIDALCAVDVFNEGVDVPRVDRVVMLRPTESPVLFLQQLGRGLRKAEAKDFLTVIDFVGNHRTFLDRVRTLLSFGEGRDTLRRFLVDGAPPELPAGCSVVLDPEAIDLLAQLLPRGGSEVERAFRELRAARADRPAAGEIYRMGYRPSTLRPSHRGWFDFLDSEGALTDDERRAFAAAPDWFRDVETEAMAKSYKMVLLEALLEADAFLSGMDLATLAQRSHGVLARSPELLRDTQGVRELEGGVDPASPAWRSYWRTNPVNAWCGTARHPGRWFKVLDGRFAFKEMVPPEIAVTFTAMVRELVDYRLAQYRNRVRVTAGENEFVCRIISNGRDPILKLPDRARFPDLPSGELDVRLPDGAAWRFRMMTQFCNVGRPVGTQQNKLPDLMRKWFGPSAGRPGTAWTVRFRRSPNGWWVEPMGQVVELPSRGRVVAYPTLRAAAGAVVAGTVEAPGAEEVWLPVKARGADIFAVRAAGSSMDGGKSPIRDGDWVLLKLSRGVGIGALKNQVVLVQVPGGQDANAWQLKRIARRGQRWELRSDNAEFPPIPATPEMIPIARMVEHVSPESLAPSPGARLDVSGVESAFGAEGVPVTGRRDGHLLVVVDGPGQLVQPDRVKVPVADRRPGEPAYVLAQLGEGTWRYCGVGRWSAAEDAWTIPEVDHPTWAQLGQGRECSRRLPADALERARVAADALVARAGQPGKLLLGGKDVRVIGRSQSGGVRIEGGEGGFGARSVSLTDLAWVLLAQDDVRERGGILDEARVNRLRYLAGTPRSSTR